MNTMDRILLIVGIAIGLFTVCMILLYIFTGGIPDTLCQCFYSICGGECGIMGIIKVFKQMSMKRTWAEEDRKNGVKVVPDYGEEEINETIVE